MLLLTLLIGLIRHTRQSKKLTLTYFCTTACLCEANTSTALNRVGYFTLFADLFVCRISPFRCTRSSHVVLKYVHKQC